MSGPPTVRLRDDRPRRGRGQRGRGGRGRGSRRPFPVGSLALALLIGAVAAAVLFAGRLGLDGSTPLLQIAAFRPQVAAGLLVVAVLAALRARRSAVAAALAVVLGVTGLAGVAAVAPRATADPAPTGGRALTVLTVNVNQGRADPDAVAGLVRDRAPDLVAVPEAGGELRRRLSARLDDDAGGAGYRSSVADGGGQGSSMTVFVKRSLGRPTVTLDRRWTFPTIVVDVPGLPRFVAVHPRSPRPGETDAWHREVADLSRWCTAGRPTVIAGDMNSTADQTEFREAVAGCTDAAAAVGEGLTATWPSSLPRALGVPIDHVLLAGGPRSRAVEVLDVPGTDHRALLATLLV